MRSYFSLFVLLVLISCQSKTPAEKILFSSNRNGNSDIFLMNADGSNVTPLIKSPAEEWGATFTDAKNITFMRQVKDSVVRFSYNLTSQEEQKLEPLGNCYLDDKNAIYNNHGDYLYSCKMGLFHQVKDSPLTNIIMSEPASVPNYLAWSFDGSFVIFTQNKNGNNDVFLMDIETYQTTNLTNHPANDERGDLSPDGKLLVFSSNRHNAKDQDLFILNLETKEVENITNSSGYDLIGRWSLDGKSILYGSNKDGNWEIYRYTLADKSTTRLTENDAFDGDPRVR